MKVLKITISHSADANDCKYGEAIEYEIGAPTIRSAVNKVIKQYVAEHKHARIRCLKISARLMSDDVRLNKLRAKMAALEAQIAKEMEEK